MDKYIITFYYCKWCQTFLFNNSNLDDKTVVFGDVYLWITPKEQLEMKTIKLYNNTTICEKCEFPIGTVITHRYPNYTNQFLRLDENLLFVKKYEIYNDVVLKMCDVNQS